MQSWLFPRCRSRLKIGTAKVAAWFQATLTSIARPGTAAVAGAFRPASWHYRVAADATDPTTTMAKQVATAAAAASAVAFEADRTPTHASNDA